MDHPLWNSVKVILWQQPASVTSIKQISERRCTYLDNVLGFMYKERIFCDITVYVVYITFHVLIENTIKKKMYSYISTYLLLLIVHDRTPFIRFVEKSRKTCICRKSTQFSFNSHTMSLCFSFLPYRIFNMWELFNSKSNYKWQYSLGCYRRQFSFVDYFYFYQKGNW